MSPADCARAMVLAALMVNVLDVLEEALPAVVAGCVLDVAVGGGSS